MKVSGMSPNPLQHLNSGHELIAAMNGEGPLALLRSSSETPMFAARWRHKNRMLSVRQAAQHILCYHESGTTAVHKYERGKLVGNRSTPGTFTFIPSDGTEWEIIGECQVTHIYIERSLIDGCVDQFASRRLDIEPFFSVDDPWLKGFFGMIIAECELYGTGTDSLLLSQCQTALVKHLLCRHGSLKMPGAGPAAVVSHAIAPARLRSVLDYIRDNLAKPMTLNELAGIACLSEYHFARRFKESTGYSPYQFVLYQRLSAAAELLAKENISVKAAAYRVGFSNSRHFSASFKAWSGKTPAEYKSVR